MGGLQLPIGLMGEKLSDDHSINDKFLIQYDDRINQIHCWLGITSKSHRLKR